MSTALFPGRFQPFHNGHLKAVQDILAAHDRVIIVIGSAEKNFLPDNPLTAGERYQIIDESLREASIPGDRYCIIPIPDIHNYALWIHHVNILVPPYENIYTGSPLVTACVQEYARAHAIPVTQLPRHDHIRAREIREKLRQHAPSWQKLVPPACAQHLQEWDIAARLEER